MLKKKKGEYSFGTLRNFGENQLFCTKLQQNATVEGKLSTAAGQTMAQAVTLPLAEERETQGLDCEGNSPSQDCWCWVWMHDCHPRSRACKHGQMT